ncbi:MAG TPA: carboxypeptidase-like regulatory domain-containing protein [Bryobacteraceae bacterium]|nr:carboxypeptidase-like regulatory domain-containing protein [Bryobacteraceae bacterium]
MLKAVRLVPLLMLVLAGAGLAQSSANPNEKPNVFLQPEPKPDKSRMRDIKGVVKDANGNFLQSATVRIKNLKTGNIAATQTKADGSYIFYDEIIDIDYEISAAREGFDPVTKRVTQYDPRKPAVRDFELQARK